MRWMHSGFTRVEIILTVVMCLVLAAVFYPLFQQPDTRPHVKVVDVNGDPIPGAILRFRDASGKVVAVITTDERGMARRSGLRKLTREYPADDYIFIRYSHSTGGSNRYTFSRTGMQEAVFRDSPGRPMPNLPVTFFHAPRTWWRKNAPHGPQDAITDEAGRVRIEHVPLPARFQFRSRDERFIVRDAEVEVRQDSVRYAVTLIPSATIKGRLVTVTGAPLGGWYAFATRPAEDGGESVYVSGVTGPSGRFRIAPLLPGTYSVSARPRVGRTSDVPANRVSVRRAKVRSGQTVSVELTANQL